MQPSDGLGAAGLAARLAQLESHARRGFLAPFLLGACVAAVALLAIAAAALINFRTSRQRRRLLETAAELAGADSGRLQQLLGDAMPAWAACPDTARVEWMNTLTKQLWPNIEVAASKQLLGKDRLLERLLNDTTFWRPRALMGATIAVQAVVLGQEPPRMTGVKCYPAASTSPGEVLLEGSFAWSSKLEIKLLVTLLNPKRGGLGAGPGARLAALLAPASRVKVSVSNLAARGTVRLAIKPLLDDLPVAGGVKLSFMGAPDFTYDISTLGGNPYLVPGVESLVSSFIRHNVLRPLTFPDGLTYNLSTRTATVFERPEGLLEVTVVEAAGVPRMDLFGKCDPYCRLWLRDSMKMHTGTRTRTLSPHWGERFTFLVHSALHQDLNFEMFDSDLWRPDDLIGRATLPLHALDLTPGATNDLWLPVPRSGKRGYGRSARGSWQGGADAAQPPVLAERLSGGEAEVEAREDSARLAFIHKRREYAPPSPEASEPPPSAPAPAEPGTPQQAQRSPRSGSPLPGVQRMSPALEHLRDLASAPLDALRSSKRCMLHVQATYIALSEQDIAAMAKEAGRQQRGEAAAPHSQRASTLGSPHVADLLRSGVLIVYLDRASGLSSSAAQGFTKNMKVKVRVGGIKKTTERGKVPFRHRSNPVFDETLELIVDGATARSELEVHVEIWTVHWLRKDTFKGRVSVPLRDVIERRRIRDTWQLQGPGRREEGQGRLTMELSWMGALAM